MAKKKETAKFLIFILIIIFLGVLNKYFKFNPSFLKAYLSGYSIIWAGIVFVTLYVVVTFFIWLSKDVFRLISALMFGAPLSTLLVWISEMINAYVLFYFSRYMGKEFIEKKIFKEKTSYYEMILEKKRSFFSLFIIRLVPLVPFRFMDMFMGLSPVSFKKYFWIVFFASPIRIYWLQSILASLGQDVFRSPEKIIYYFLTHKIIFIISLIYVILIIVISFIFIPKK